MTSENDDGVVGELAHVAANDPIRAVLGACVAEVLAMLPDGYARRVVIEEILETEGRIRSRLVRRWVN